MAIPSNPLRSNPASIDLTPSSGAKTGGEESSILSDVDALKNANISNIGKIVTDLATEISNAAREGKAEDKTSALNKGAAAIACLELRETATQQTMNKAQQTHQSLSEKKIGLEQEQNKIQNEFKEKEAFVLKELNIDSNELDGKNKIYTSHNAKHDPVIEKYNKELSEHMKRTDKLTKDIYSIESQIYDINYEIDFYKNCIDKYFEMKSIIQERVKNLPEYTDTNFNKLKEGYAQQISESGDPPVEAPPSIRTSGTIAETEPLKNIFSDITTKVAKSLNKGHHPGPVSPVVQKAALTALCAAPLLLFGPIGFLLALGLVGKSIADAGSKEKEGIGENKGARKRRSLSNRATNWTKKLFARKFGGPKSPQPTTSSDKPLASETAAKVRPPIPLRSDLSESGELTDKK